MWRNKDDNETPIWLSLLQIKLPYSWSWKLRLNTWIRLEFCLLGSRPIDPKQRIRMPKHRDETEVSKTLRKFIEDDVFLGFFVCISTVCIKCVSRKGKTLSTNKYTNVGKRCFHLNREANYRPQCAFDDSAEEGMFAFRSIFSLGFLLLFIVH